MAETIRTTVRDVTEEVERPDLRLGFVALADCAPIVVAKERGFFRNHGLNVTLERQASWATVRDKVGHGLLDGAQMLAPMPLAASLGLEGVLAPMIVPVALSLGGNAITVSSTLLGRMTDADPRCRSDLSHARTALASLIQDGRRTSEPRLRFGVVYPYSSHYYQLCYWLASVGIDPLRDVSIRVVPPASMVRALEAGEIDGYAVGEPWNQLAVDRTLGQPLVASHDIWQSSPEKVFAVTQEWADRHPATLRALVRAILEASAWIDRSENRLEVVHVIAGESYVDAPVTTLRESMLCTDPEETGGIEARTFHTFHRNGANYPWISHAMWFLTQMIRWGQIEKPFDLEQFSRTVYRPDLCREAAEEVSIATPEIDLRVEGLHADDWELAAASVPIAMRPDRFLDGHVFRPDEPIAYLESFEVSAMRVRLDDLALCNS